MPFVLGTLIFAVLGWLAYLFLTSQKVSAPASNLFWEAVKDFEAGKNDEAEKKFLKHLTTRTNHVQSYMYLVEIYKKKGRKNRELQTCKTLMELWESGYHEFKIGKVQKNLGELLFEKEQYEEAFYHYAGLLKGMNADPTVDSNANTTEFVDDFTLRNVAFLLASQGRYEKALEYYENLINKNPRDWTSVRGKVPCLIGTGNWKKAEACIRELISNKESRVDDYYYLGKIYQQLQDPGNAKSCFMEFLQKVGSEQAYDGYDALAYLIQSYYAKVELFSENEIENWIKVFRCSLDHIYLKDHQEREIHFQKGFLHFFKTHEKEEFRDALREWTNLSRADPNYKDVERLIEKLKNYKKEFFRDLELAYKAGKKLEDELFEDPRPFRSSDMFDVLPFESDVVSEFLDPSFLGGIKKTFSRGKKQTSKDLEALSVYQFDRRMEEVFKKMKLSIEKKLKSDSSGIAFRYLLKNKDNKFTYCAVYRHSKEIGEVEVKQIITQMKNYDLVGAIMITLGSFTMKAASIAREHSVEVITGVILQDKYLSG